MIEPNGFWLRTWQS